MTLRTTTTPRERMVRAAVELLTRGGREAVSTRAVGAAAGVQAPAIYRQFGDMRGLLHAAARQVLAAYVKKKAALPVLADPVAALARGWDLHVAFGLANPDAYALLYADAAGAPEDPEMSEGHAVLEGLVTRVAEAGLLRVSVAHAVRLIRAAATGVTLQLVGTPEAERDAKLSGAMRDAVFTAILATDKPRKAAPGEGGRVAARAVALRAVLGEAGATLSAGERQLLEEWLDRLA
jgi:AcrR family transcriptional regulator